MVNLDQTQASFSKTIVVNPEFTRLMCLTGGLLTASLHYPSHGALSKVFTMLMRTLSLCPHANVGWPIRCDGEERSSQHCFDCGAQRTYTLQPKMQKGPWERPQLCSTQPFAWARRYTGGVARTIVDVDQASPSGLHGVSAREDDVAHVASALIVGFWSEIEEIAPQQANIRLQNVEESDDSSCAV